MAVLYTDSTSFALGHDVAYTEMAQTDEALSLSFSTGTSPHR